MTDTLITIVAVVASIAFMVFQIWDVRRWTRKQRELHAELLQSRQARQILEWKIIEMLAKQKETK